MAERQAAHLVSSPVAGSGEPIVQKDGRMSNGDTLDHSRRILEELRAKYSLERRELMSAVGDQIRQMKVENVSLTNMQAETDHKVEAIRRRLAAMEAAIENPSAVSLPEVLENCSAKLSGIDAQLQKGVEETELLKSAVMHDRMRREDMQRSLAVEDEELENRLQRLEDTNAQLDTELDQLRTTYADVSDAAFDVITAHQEDAPTSHMTDEIRKIHDEVLDDLSRIREENAQMTARMQSIAAFCEEQERKREHQILSLENVLHHAEGFKQSNPVSTGGISLCMPLDYQTSSNGGTSTPPPMQLLRRKEPQVPTFRDVIAEFYLIHNPAKLEMLDNILAEYHGAEEELMDALEAHYGAFGFFRH